jgi:hypothetical protein
MRLSDLLTYELVFQNNEAMTNDKAIWNPLAPSESNSYIDVTLTKQESDASIMKLYGLHLVINLRRSSNKYTITRSDYSAF